MTALRRMRGRVALVGASLIAALMLSLATVAPVFAEAGDGDGFDGDESGMLVAVVGLIVIAGIAAGAYWLVRSSRNRGQP